MGEIPKSLFEITKSKGKAYKTEDPYKAIKAYRNKKALSMYHGNTVVRTKCILNGEHSSRIATQYLERC